MKITRLTIILVILFVAGIIQVMAGETEPPVLLGKNATIKPIVENGIYHQSWFEDSFLDLKEDLLEATKAGKRLVVIFEQRGCIYCKKFHEKILGIKQVNDYIRQNFTVVQLNLWGDREVTDFDGKVMSEKRLARRWGIMNTPTALFMTDNLTGKAGKYGKDLAVIPLFYPGAFGPYTTFDMFVWVAIKGYEREEPFQKFHARRLKAAKVF
jgi:thioredoxin-related protein